MVTVYIGAAVLLLGFVAGRWYQVARLRWLKGQRDHWRVKAAFLEALNAQLMRDKNKLNGRLSEIGRQFRKVLAHFPSDIPAWHPEHAPLSASEEHVWKRTRVELAAEAQQWTEEAR